MQGLDPLAFGPAGRQETSPIEEIFGAHLHVSNAQKLGVEWLRTPHGRDNYLIKPYGEAAI
jgi:hypothetical protein